MKGTSHGLRRQILGAEIFVLGTPIWTSPMRCSMGVPGAPMGHPASVSQMVLERLDAFLGETDDDGRTISYDRVAIVGVVGNEDGAHHAGAEIFQGLNDVGFTLPANAMTYWVGEAMHKLDFKDVIPAPTKTLGAADQMVGNAMHLADLLRKRPYPA